MIAIPRCLLAVATAGLLGCNGEITEPGAFAVPIVERGAPGSDSTSGMPAGPDPAAPGGSAGPASSGDPGAPGDGAPDDGTAPPAEPPWEPGFGIDDSQPALLPIDMRLRRLAGAIGLPVADPLFDGVRDARIALGGYDHAQGVLPDGLWIASRMASWVRVLRPICTSAPMRERYPALPEALPALIRAAWGRAAQAEDLAAFEEEIAASGLAAAEQYEALCLAVFSAAEFVYQ
jgi:hypothetical protein